MSVRFEEGEFGKKAVLTSPWSASIHSEIIQARPEELELNAAKGWSGTDLKFVESYDWLKSFTIIDMKIDDISAVMSLHGLVSLSIVTYCKTKLDFTRFPDLRNCSLEWRRGAESLFDCVMLTDLFLNCYDGKSSSPFSSLVNLRTLAILNSPLSELNGLAGLKGLRSLRLAGLKLLSSLDGLEHLHRLEKFEMQLCKSVHSLAPLGSLKNLVDVNISNNGKLDSLSPLGALPKLRSVLFYESTDIVDGDLRPIFDNPGISKVSFQNRRHYSHKREQFAGRR